MPTRARDDAQSIVEAEWQRLRRQCELADSFWLGFIFSRSGEPATQLRQRVERIEQSRRQGPTSLPQTTGVTVMKPASPAELRNLLVPLFEEPTSRVWCVWVEAMHPESSTPDEYSDEPAGPWAAAWDWLMMRANEHRDGLRRHVNGGLVFAVPSEWKPRVRNAAPDLWSVRSLVLEMPDRQRKNR